MKRNIKIILLIVITIILLVAIFLIANRGSIFETNLKNYKAESSEFFSYIVYDNQDKQNIKVLATINSEKGIEYIERQDGTKINANGKNTIAVDCSVKENVNYNIRIKEIGSTVQQKNILVNNDTLAETTIGIKTVADIGDYKIYKLCNNMILDDFEAYYKIGENGQWKEESTADDKTISLSVYDDTIMDLINDDNTITLSFKIINSTNNNQVMISKDIDLTAKEIMTIDEAKAIINRDNIRYYIGARVAYTPEDDISGVYRIFYLDTEGKYGSKNRLYLKRDYDNISVFYGNNKAGYSASSEGIEMMKLMNPLWKQNDGVINSNNERVVSYLCEKNFWTQYLDENVAEYTIGSPSVEMYIDAYNQWKGVETSENSPLNYRFVSGENGYSIAVNGTYHVYYGNSFESGYGNVFVKNGQSWTFLSSPIRSDINRLVGIHSNNTSYGYFYYVHIDTQRYIMPLVALYN